MSEGVVHIALKGDVVGMCDAPIDRSAPRAEEPEQATCEECIDIYIEGWAAAQEQRCVGAPPMPPYPPSPRRPAWLMVAAGVGLTLAVGGVVYAFTGGGDGTEHVTGSVIDCSQTELFRPEGSAAMLPARVAQIRFVNDGDQQETFSPQVDGVTLVANDGSPAKFTLAPHESKVINYPLNPQRYGSSEGSCYALGVSAAR
ncbi:MULTISPECIES: hypothetical protein [unclassified Streptomyces]|uniref:hypothetical protein n=1 Tax=unclassified Streptomyces TaxID=2593676 RepID=UPI0035DD28FD